MRRAASPQPARLVLKAGTFPVIAHTGPKPPDKHRLAFDGDVYEVLGVRHSGSLPRARRGAAGVTIAARAGGSAPGTRRALTTEGWSPNL